MDAQRVSALGSRPGQQAGRRFGTAAGAPAAAWRLDRAASRTEAGGGDSSSAASF